MRVHGGRRYGGVARCSCQSHWRRPTSGLLPAEALKRPYCSTPACQPSTVPCPSLRSKLGAAVGARLPPLLILHGTVDKSVPMEVAVEFVAALKVRAAACTAVLTVVALIIGWLGLGPGAGGGGAVCV